MTSAPFMNTDHGLETDPVRNFRFLVTISANDTKNGPFGYTADDKTKATKSKSATLGFVSVSGLSVTTESIGYREGGYNTTVHQIPGQTTFTPITLSRGILLGTDQNYQWMRRMFALNTGLGNGGIGSDFRCSVEIAVLSHPNTTGYKAAGATDEAQQPGELHTSMRFKVHNAWITNLSYSDLNAGENSLLVESMTLVHEGWQVNFAQDLKTTAAAY